MQAGESAVQQFASTGDVARLGLDLDAGTHLERLELLKGLRPRQQADLFEAAAGGRAWTEASLVPPGTPPLHGVRHQGRNSLPAFRGFEKVFFRDAEAGGAVWGYNRTGAFVENVVGPGYFGAAVEDGEVVIDYRRVPEAGPAGGPPPLDNAARLSRFVYNGMVDIVRGISEHVAVGRAYRNDKPADNWFVLCRLEGET